MNKHQQPTPGAVSITFDSMVKGRALVHVSGDVDALITPRLREMSDVSAEATTVVVDLIDATFMDSAGLGALLTLVRATGNRDAEMVVVCPEGQVRRLLKVTGVEKLTTVLDELPPWCATIRASEKKKHKGS